MSNTTLEFCVKWEFSLNVNSESVDEYLTSYI